MKLNRRKNGRSRKQRMEKEVVGGGLLLGKNNIRDFYVMALWESVKEILENE